MAGNQRTGKAFIEIDGVVYESMKDSKLTDVIGVKADPVIAATGVVGYADEPVATILATKLIVGNGITSDTVKNITFSEGQFVCDTGEIYLLTGLFRMKADLDPANHILDCQFGMTDCTPIAV